MKLVKNEVTALRLCRALASLQKKQRALWEFFGNEDCSIDEIDDVMEAILDLCEVPADDFVNRSSWKDEIDDIITADASEKDFNRLFRRLKEINQEVASDSRSSLN